MSVDIYPVVHVRGTEQAVEQSSLAYELGADGVYLIDHRNPLPEDLVLAFNAVEAEHPDKFIGVNFLQFPSSHAGFGHLADLSRYDLIRRLPDGLWTDNAALLHEGTAALRQAQPPLQGVRYLGGTAFKYTESYTADPDEAAEQAVALSGYVDVITTSGPGTGEAANPEKIAAMKAAIGSKKLAIASGISEANLELYREHTDEILVSTSVETKPQSGIFNAERLKALIDMAHAA